MSPDGKLPRGVLMEKKPTIKYQAKQFELVKELDMKNEKRPKRKWEQSQLKWHEMSERDGSEGKEEEWSSSKVLL